MHTGSLNARSALDAPQVRAEGRAQRAILSPLPSTSPLAQRQSSAPTKRRSTFARALRVAFGALLRNVLTGFADQSEIVKGY